MTIQENVQRRMKSRTRVLMTATVTLADGPHRVLVRDISRYGAQVYADKAISKGQDVCFARASIFVAGRVVWYRKGIAGLEFYRDLSTSEVQEAFHSVDMGRTEA